MICAEQQWFRGFKSAFLCEHSAKLSLAVEDVGVTWWKYFFTAAQPFAEQPLGLGQLTSFREKVAQIRFDCRCIRLIGAPGVLRDRKSLAKHRLGLIQLALVPQ
jgi:hypothetical protein